MSSRRVIVGDHVVPRGVGKNLIPNLRDLRVCLCSGGAMASARHDNQYHFSERMNVFDAMQLLLEAVEVPAEISRRG